MVTASSRVDKFSKSDIIVSPSILSANFSKLGEQVCGRMDLLPYHIYIDLMKVYFYLETRCNKYCYTSTSSKY